jgi:uncharacterized surface anchored protein
MNSITTGHRRTVAYSGRITPKANLPMPQRELRGPAAAANLVLARLVDDETGKPISGAGYELLDADGKVVAVGRTDYTGVVRHEVRKVGRYQVRLTEEAAPEKKPLPADSPGGHVIFARIVADDSDEAMARAKYEILDEEGTVIAKGEADENGLVERKVEKVGRYRIRLAA